MPKPLRNTVSGFDVFFIFRTAVLNLLTVELTAFYTVKEKEKKEKKRRG